MISCNCRTIEVSKFVPSLYLRGLLVLAEYGIRQRGSGQNSLPTSRDVRMLLIRAQGTTWLMGP